MTERRDCRTVGGQLLLSKAAAGLQEVLDFCFPPGVEHPKSAARLFLLCECVAATCCHTEPRGHVQAALLCPVRRRC